MGKTRLEQMQQQMIRRYGTQQGSAVSQRMQQEFTALCKACSKEPKSLQHHLHNNILPVVCTFRALMAQGIQREQAAKTAGDAFLELMNEPAQGIRKMMKIPGLYRLMPWLWKKLMPKMFSEDSGFRFQFHATGSREVKFDMTECPYARMCRELDCPELAPVFCTTDDVCYGHMHPKLIWNRTKTLARGGDFCDFDLYISE